MGCLLHKLILEWVNRYKNNKKQNMFPRAPQQLPTSRPNRLNTSLPKRSTTPQHPTSQAAPRISQSQSKPHVDTSSPPLALPLPSILEQEQGAGFEKPFYIGKGNNGELIKKILMRRKGWKEVTGTEFVYFRWVQNSFSFKFHLLGKECYCFNHFEYQRELSHKQRLVKNLINFCQANKMNAYNFVPVSFILDLNTGDQDLALHAFIKFFNRNYPDQSNPRRHQSIILPRSKYIPYMTAQQLNKRSQGNFYCKPFCPRSFFDEETKSYLWILKPTFLNRGRGVVLFRELDELEKLIWKYYQGEGLEDYGDKYTHDDKGKMDVSANLEEPDHKMGKKESENQVDDESKPQNHNTKVSNQTATEPSQSVSQQDKKELSIKKIEQEKQKQKSNENSVPKVEEQQTPNAHLNSKRELQLPRCLSFIIQKYIEKPMLIEGKKFDIRVWVLLTQTLQFYMFEQAYLRFSSQPYSTKDSHLNPFVHLTNNSVQKYCNQYNPESGNQWPLSAIQSYIQPHSKSSSIYSSILSKIKQIISLSIYSVRRKINVNSRKQCFQLFGYDFMIDAEYKVWLIEVNTNPAIEEASPLLKMLLPRMVDDMFKLTIDRIFHSRMKDDIEEFKVTGHDDAKNMWEYLGDLREGGGLKNEKRLTFARR